MSEHPGEAKVRRGYFNIAKTLVETRHGEFNALMSEREQTAGIKSLMGPIGRAMLYALVRHYQPRIIVESGGNLGMASSFMLKAMHDNDTTDGKLYSIERSRKIVPGSIIPEEIKGPYVPLQGAVEDFLTGDQIPGEIDMFLHDSTHRYDHMTMEFAQFWPRLRPGGLLVSHDVNMNAAFTDFVSKTYAHDEGGIAIPEADRAPVLGVFCGIGVHGESVRKGDAGGEMREVEGAMKKDSVTLSEARHERSRRTSQFLSDVPSASGQACDSGRASTTREVLRLRYTPLRMTEFYPATRNPQPATRNPQPATRNPQPASRIPHPATRIPHPASRIPHPATRIPHPASRIPHRRFPKWGVARLVLFPGSGQIGRDVF